MITSTTNIDMDCIGHSSGLNQRLQQLCLPNFAKEYNNMAIKSENEKQSYVRYLSDLVEIELEYRHRQRIEKLIKAAKLPRSKHLADFNLQRIPGLSKTLVNNLSVGDFIDRYENILIFGNPGTGKTHLAIGLAREWCLLGRRVYYVNAASLVQQLLQAKSDLKLNQFIKKIDFFEVLIIDDISYIPYDRAEMDVLFQLLSSRYEMKSTVITSNLPFSKWQTLFKDEMTTAAVIDRLVHHSIILELNTESYRMAEAKATAKIISPDTGVTETQKNQQNELKNSPQKKEAKMPEIP